MPTTCKRGLGLASTLMLGTLMVTAGFTMTSQCISHLAISNRLDNLSQARCLAEAAAEMAIARALTDPSFGTVACAQDPNVEITFPSGGVGRATFDPARAGQWHMPQSCNNLRGAASTAGYQRTVPARGMQVISEGRVNGVSRRLEGVLYLPPYKYALASSGTIASSGSLTVVGIKDPQAVAGGVNSIPADQILPGNVASNGKSQNALNLDSDPQKPSRISGDAQSGGTVRLGPSTTVDGAVKQNAEAAALPEIHIEDFDPAGFNSVQTLSQGTYTSQLTATGLLRRQGNLTVTSGGLNLDSGYLYVQGNLEVWGGLTGKGAVFATGDLRIHGMSSFSANSEQALLAKGNLSVEGLAQNASFLQGLIYTEGDFQAHDLTLLGSFVGNKRSGAGTAMTLDRVNAVQNPQALSFTFTNPIVTPSTQPPTCLSGGLTGVFITTVPQTDVSSFYDAATDSFVPGRAQTAPLTYTIESSNFTTTDLGALEQAYQSAGGSASHEAFLSAMQSVGDFRRGELQQQIQDLDKLYQKTKMTSLIQGSFSLDPNQFVQLSDRMRKILWREL